MKPQVKLRALSKLEQIDYLMKGLGLTQVQAREFLEHAVLAEWVESPAKTAVKMDFEAMKGKSGMLEYLSQVTGEKSALMRQVLNTVLAAWGELLKKNRRVSLFDLGTLTVTEAAKRKAKNPQTGEAVTVKAHKRIKYNPAVSLKKAVWDLKYLGGGPRFGRGSFWAEALKMG